jgi:outer membrane protein TolC
MPRGIALLALIVGIVGSASAQDSTLVPRLQPAATLTLTEAIQQAQRNSPTYRQTLNNAGPARWAVRNAYGNLLPQAQVSSGMSYTGSGESQFGAFFNQTSPFWGSNYQLGLQWQLSGTTLTGPAQQKALERATQQDIEDAGVGLRFDVTTQYFTVAAATAQTEVAREQVRRNSEFLRLARTRYQVGQATLLDVRQAEATHGTSQVSLLRAAQAENEAKLELFRRMGVVPPTAVEQVALIDSFPVTEPTYKLDDILRLAEDQNPSLRALRERQSAAGAAVRSARSEYLPTLTARAAWSGFTQQYTNVNTLLGQQLTAAQSSAAQCQFNNQVRTGLGLGGTSPDCFSPYGLNPSGTQLLGLTEQGIRNQNSVFPFDYRHEPFQASLTLSLPIFTGFGRSLRLSQARASRDDAEESVRASALLVRANVHARYLALQTSYRAIGIQEYSRTAAREQLRLAQDRYRVGLGTALDVTDAQNAVQRAEGDYVNAVYEYHRATAALEAAVGRSLR